MRHSVFRHSPPPHLPAITYAGGPVAKIALAFFAAGAIGVALAHYLRTRRQMAWTWSLLTLVPPSATIAALIEGVFPLTFTSGLALAAMVGLAFGSIAYSVHTRADDRRSGADREAAAKRRRGVLDAPRRRAAQRFGPGRRLLEKQVPLGRDERGALVCISRGTASSGAHVLIPGATGAGKTTSLAALLVDYVGSSGFGAVVLEAKSDERPARGGGQRRRRAAESPSASSRPRGLAAMTRWRGAASTSAPSG